MSASAARDLPIIRSWRAGWWNKASTACRSIRIPWWKPGCFSPATRRSDAGRSHPQQAFAVVLQLADGFAHILERQMGRILAESLRHLRRPALRQLFERAHIEIAI